MSIDVYPAASSASKKGGAFGPRPRGRLLVAVVVLAAIALTAGVLISGAANSHSSNNSNAVDSKYGGYPSWLPHTKLPPVNTVLQASLSHPQLDAIEGNTMAVALPSGSEAEITAVGPALPAWVSAAVQAGTLNDANPVPTTFTVTVIARRGTVPLGASAFSILTAAGQLLHPAVTGPGGERVPATLRAGEHLNLTLKAELVEGDGSLRWAPVGPRVLSGWLYQLELD
jgi:hypothetical protein